MKFFIKYPVIVLVFAAGTILSSCAVHSPPRAHRVVPAQSPYAEEIKAGVPGTATQAHSPGDPASKSTAQ